LPRHDARFAVTPAEKGSAFVPVDSAQSRDVLLRSGRAHRRPGNTVAWNGHRLQIPKPPARAHFVRAKVRVYEYPGGALAIFHGPRCLARWREGEPTVETAIASSASPAFAPEQACGRPGQAALARPTHRTTETKAVNLCATQTGRYRCNRLIHDMISFGIRESGNSASTAPKSLAAFGMP
jgi:hypothetical protein